MNKKTVKTIKKLSSKLLIKSQNFDDETFIESVKLFNEITKALLDDKNDN